MKYKNLSQTYAFLFLVSSLLELFLRLLFHLCYQLVSSSLVPLLCILYIYIQSMLVFRSSLEEEVVCELIFEFHTCKIT